jgi:hypothetical protein
MTAEEVLLLSYLTNSPERGYWLTTADGKRYGGFSGSYHAALVMRRIGILTYTLHYPQ